MSDPAVSAGKATTGASLPGQSGFSVFVQLERAARHAQTVEALRFVMVNETRRLLPYRQAAVSFLLPSSRARVEAVSGVALLDRNAPFLGWLDASMAHGFGQEDARQVHVVTRDQLPEIEREGWAEWSAAHVLWVPLLTAGELVGALWLSRDTPWGEAEQVLAGQLADAYAHAWKALTRPHSRRLSSLSSRRKLLWALPLLAGLVLAIPVPQSALAPAQVVAHQPTLVAAPLDGVIAGFSVQPNQQVRTGDPLLYFDDTNLRSQRDVAQRTLEVAEAELRRASQGAFQDRESSAQVAMLRARVALRQSELAYAEALLERVVVRAAHDGIVVFGDPLDWIGRPVRTGERILQLANPAATELRIELPVGQALALTPGAAVEMFFDNAPLQALEATLERTSYEAELTPEGVLAYRLNARFKEGTLPPRIGLRGTAKVYGEDASLFMLLFRRPLSALRQTLGF